MKMARTMQALVTLIAAAVFLLPVAHAYPSSSSQSDPIEESSTSRSRIISAIIGIGLDIFVIPIVSYLMGFFSPIIGASIGAIIGFILGLLFFIIGCIPGAIIGLILGGIVGFGLAIIANPITNCAIYAINLAIGKVVGDILAGS